MVTRLTFYLDSLLLCQTLWKFVLSNSYLLKGHKLYMELLVVKVKQRRVLGGLGGGHGSSRIDNHRGGRSQGVTPSRRNRMQAHISVEGGKSHGRALVEMPGGTREMTAWGGADRGGGWATPKDQKVKMEPQWWASEVESGCWRTKAELVQQRPEVEPEGRRSPMELKGWRDEAKPRWIDVLGSLRWS